MEKVLSQTVNGLDYVSRAEKFAELFPQEKAYRFKQLEESMITKSYNDFAQITNLPEPMRKKLHQEMSWLSIKPMQTLQSKRGDTFKAALKIGSFEFESVLMKNKGGNWTICVSSQIGCGMGCAFCATGKMGFKANLHSDNIVDQYRYWDFFVRQNPELGGRISNMVFMGMGEPLANYDNVKTAINLLLKYTDLGPTKITVSSVGLIPILNKMLNDEDWPNVRIAISVHSADIDTRKAIVKTSYDKFLIDLVEWGRAYNAKFGNRRHHLTFEYVMLNKANDSEMHAQKLAKLINDIGGVVKVNLIPYNWTDSLFDCSTDERFKAFMHVLQERGVNVTRRKTMGEDIAAACGQLIKLRERAV